MNTKREVIRYPLWRAHRTAFIAIAIVVVLAAATGGYFAWPRTVYLTDGSHVFSPDLAPIEQLILEENHRVADSGKPYVSIVFADPMAPAETDPINASAVRHDLQGAYIAQRAWNDPAKKQIPLVRLLLADMGSEQAYRYEAAQEIRDRMAEEHIVAVTGLGVSRQTVREFIDELAKDKLAIVAGAITGDEMTKALTGGGTVPGMVRVAPTNSDLVVAMIRYLDKAAVLPAKARVLEVRDQNEGDNYTATLGRAFADAIRADKTGKYELVDPPMVFNSTLDSAGTILGGNANKVCDHRVDLVHFAGRGADLRGFLHGLALRTCAAERPLLVLGPPDIARNVDDELWRSGSAANMTLLVPGLTSAEMWERDKGAASAEIVARFGECAGCYRDLFQNETMFDSDAALSHDAVWTAILAIQQVVKQTKSTRPKPAQVAQALNQLTVSGVSGWICTFDANHNPVNKAVPILTLDHDGKLKYQGLSSTLGSPAINGCG